MLSFLGKNLVAFGAWSKSGFGQCPNVLLFVRSDGLAGGDSEVRGVPRATGARLPLHLFPHHHRASGVSGRAAV